MQCHNYISDVYNKPNRLKIGWKLSKLLFKKYMYHYQHNVMGERADCSKMADVRLRWPATRTRHLVFIYIYGPVHLSACCIVFDQLTLLQMLRLS